jgi:hypothetical protein
VISLRSPKRSLEVKKIILQLTLAILEQKKKKKKKIATHHSLFSIDKATKSLYQKYVANQIAVVLRG